MPITYISSSLLLRSPCHGVHNAGRMHFVKFETARIEDCLDFIQAKGLHRTLLRDGSSREVRVKATGGGAHKFAGERGVYLHVLEVVYMSKLNMEA